MSKYAGRGAYKGYALIAGFVEIGETFEDTVRREVMEEVGLKVEKIKIPCVTECNFLIHLCLLLNIIGKTDICTVLKPNAVYILKPPR